MKARRLLYVVNDDRFFVSHRLPLARAAAQSGFAVGVAAPPGPSEAAIRAAGFAFFPVRFRRGSLNPLGEITPYRDLVRAYDAFAPHLGHHLTFKPIVMGALVARRMRIPVVNAITGLGYAFTDDGWMRWLLRTVAEAGYRMALRRPGTRTIFQNADDQALFVARGLVRHEDTRVVRGSGVDLDRFAPTPEPSESHGPPVVLFAARMLWDKGVGELIDAVRMLKADGVPFRMLLAGAPDRSNPVAVPEARLRAWEAEGLVEWLGHRDDMPALLAQSNIVCLPSYYREGVPLTLIEAAACGRPIVATDAPGCREIVQHGVNGLCVAPRDPTALVEALRRLIADPALRRSMGAAGHEWVRAHFTVQRVIEQTLVVYAELVAAEGSRPGDS